MPLKEFETWVYETDALRPVLGESHFLELLSFTFNGERASTLLADLLIRFAEEIDLQEFIKQRASLTLEGMLDGTITLPAGCGQLTRFRNSGGEGFIPIEFEGYYSELDTVPEPEQFHLWDAVALHRQMERLELYKEGVLLLARETLSSFTSSTGGAT